MAYYLKNRFHYVVNRQLPAYTPRIPVTGGSWLSTLGLIVANPLLLSPKRCGRNWKVEGIQYGGVVTFLRAEVYSYVLHTQCFHFSLMKYGWKPLITYSELGHEENTRCSFCAFVLTFRSSYTILYIIVPLLQ